MMNMKGGTGIPFTAEIAYLLYIGVKFKVRTVRRRGVSEEL